MRAQSAPGERPLYWVASAKKDLLEMPGPVVREMGVALGVAQQGGKYLGAKPWKGLGPGTLQIVSNFDSNTFRAVYTVRFRKAVYVLHCFQKKSPKGIETAKSDVDLIKRRLKTATDDYEARYGKAEEAEQ